jgi:CHAT domain-containing protein/Tfp pilus assembly protein PilF
MMGDGTVRTVLAFVILVMVIAVSVGGEASHPAEIAEASNPDETAAALTERAKAHISKGEYQKALPLLQRALEIREKQLGPEHPETATSLNNLGFVYGRMGEYLKALPLLQRALEIREKQLGWEHPETATSLHDLGTLYIDMGDYPKALPLLQQALEIREKQLGPEHPDTATSLDNLALLYQEMGDYQKALPLYQRALAIREKQLGPEHPETATSLNNLAMLYVNMGEYQKALPLLQRALAIDEKQLGREHPDTATSLNNLAFVYYRMGEYQKALPLLQRTLAISEKQLGPEHPNTALFLISLAAFYYSMGEYPKAFESFQAALNAENHTWANVFAITSESQKLQFVQRSQYNYLATLSLIHRHFQKDPPALRFGLESVLRRKGLVLDAQSQSSATLAANLQGETLKSWQRLIQHQSNLAHLLLSGPGEQSTNDYRQAIEDLEAAIAREEQFLRQHSSQVAPVLPQATVTAEMLAGRLPPDSALVEFVHIEDWDEKTGEWADTSRYLAFVLTPDNQVRMVDLGDAQQIDTKIITTLAAINDSIYEQDLKSYHRADAALSELYRLLLQPLAPALGSYQQLLVSPDGELNKVPFAALRAPDGRYLVETHTVPYVASGRDLLRGDSAATSSVDLLLLANPAYGAPPPEGDFFDPLPGTAKEAKAIRPLVKGKQLVLEGQAATESAVRATKSPKVLHLATHGFFLEDQELPVPAPLSEITGITDAGAGGPGGLISSMVRSGLALAGANQAGAVSDGDDGVLTALEVTGLNLYGTDLVVLSACETGVGEVRTGEGVFGLRRAFVLAGAKNLVMSQWRANDYYTAAQMEQFYQAVGRGVSPAEALREAQLAMISSLREQMQGEGGEPIAPVNLWAPFMVQQTGG